MVVEEEEEEKEYFPVQPCLRKGDILSFLRQTTFYRILNWLNAEIMDLTFLLYRL